MFELGEYRHDFSQIHFGAGLAKICGRRLVGFVMGGSKCRFKAL